MAHLITTHSGKVVEAIDCFGRHLATVSSAKITGADTYLSGLAYDPSNGSQWVVREVTGQPRAWNFWPSGKRDYTFPGAAIDNSITELEDMVVDPTDFTFWMIDDTPGYCRLWHTQRDGTVIAGPYDLEVHGCVSVQGVDYDPVADTFLIPCNVTAKVYEVDRSNNLIGVTSLSGISPQPASWQGIAVDTRDGNWFLGGYTSGSTPNIIVKVEARTTNVIRSFGTPFDPNLSGLAFVPDLIA